MKISPININSIKYFNSAKQGKNINFDGGYKDIQNEFDKREFEYHLDKFIKESKSGCFFNKKQDVKVGNYSAQMSVYRDKDYVLSSKSNQIKAIMEAVPFYSYFSRKSKDEYTKKGALSIALLFSKGKGAGSFLVKEAVKKSKEMGFDGRVILFASTIEDAAGCPIPFYNKLGFVADDKQEQKEIEKGMKNFHEKGIYNGPNYVDMHLATERIKDYLD